MIIFLRYGVPSKIFLDRASYFNSHVMETVAKILGWELCFRHSYIHISNGKIETQN